MDILQEYQRIMKAESRLIQKTSKHPLSGGPIIADPTELQWMVELLAEVAKNSLVPRSYITRYGLDEKSHLDITDKDGTLRSIVHESVGAHANLVMALMDRALFNEYGGDFGEPDSEHTHTVDGYSYRQIAEAVRLHDLPENKFGDIPDNGGRDEAKKEADEHTYFADFYTKYPRSDRKFKRKAYDLLSRMHDPHSPTGQLLFLADKTAASFITLTYDNIGLPPMKFPGEVDNSLRDIEEISLCDYVSPEGGRRASEMWAVDYFHIRKFTELDDTGFFTAVIVMYTLMVNGKWYSWREKDYSL